jgi:hypothetical protein
MEILSIIVGVALLFVFWSSIQKIRNVVDNVVDLGENASNRLNTVADLSLQAWEAESKKDLVERLQDLKVAEDAKQQTERDGL